VDDPRTLPGRTVYLGRRIEVRTVQVRRPDGTIADRDLVLHRGSVGIVARDADGSLVLIRNRRYAVGETLWELPAGTLEPGESPQDCARRELREETGFEAGRIVPLGRFFLSPGYCSEEMHAFLATDLEAVGQDLDDGEEISVEVVPDGRVRAMIRDGTLRDGKTLAMLALERARG